MKSFVVFSACILFSSGFCSDAAIPRGEFSLKTGLIEKFLLNREKYKIQLYSPTHNFIKCGLSSCNLSEKELFYKSKNILKILPFPPSRSALAEQGGEDKGGVNKKWIAVLLAFPLPLGILGAHRIYLGTKPLVPVVYIVTLGGAAGILPLIDFFVLAFADDIAPYENNPNIIMWMNDVQ